ncbi:MAG: Hsp20/alpha crystallin family protein [Nitrospirota bacterium]
MAAEKTKQEEGREMASRRPFSELTRMEREMERWFDDVLGGPWRRFGLPDWWRRRELIPRQPAIEISEDRDSLIVKAEIPGLKKEDLQVNLAEGLLTIRGERKHEEEKKEKGYFYSERSYGSFSRSIQLPAEVQSDKVNASFKDGVLEIRLPKTEQAKQREVSIKVQ